jgi:nucleoside-diphosphate-sugar epimerase
MRILVLRGTRFLGRHLVDAALSRGHRATIDDAAAWLRQRDNSGASRNVLSAAKEREILADAA